MAFVNILTTPRGIRIYQVIGGRLQSLCQDIVPTHATALPSPEDDDLLSVDPTDPGMDIVPDDTNLWVDTPDTPQPEQDDAIEDDASIDTSIDEEPEQMFFRLLFHAGGHYDALVTDTQKRLICHAFPSVAHEFRPM